MKITNQLKSSLDTTNLFNEFIDEKEHDNLSKASLISYAMSFKYFCQYTDGELHKDNVYKFIDALKSRGAHKSINHHLTQLRTFINWCIRNEYIEPFEVKLLRQQEPAMNRYSRAECVQLLAEPSKKDTFRTWRTYCMIAFMLGTGCRLGTLINIELQDINSEGREVTYRHLKTKESAVIPLSSHLYYTIKKYKSLFNLETFLFPDYNNEKMTENSVRMSIRKYCTDRGVAFRGVHAFRHTFASMYIIDGGDAFTLQKILCHKDITTTQRYVNLFGGDLHTKVEMYSPLESLQQNKVKKQK